MNKISVWTLELLKYFDRFIFNHLKRRGIQTTYWVLNEKEEFDKALKSGVDCIMSDYPSYIMKFAKLK